MGKSKNFNIPNMLSIFRILLIPLFVSLYLLADSEHTYLYYYSSGILIISGLTDVFDGVIARKFGQITQLGKILDPLADKLTQLVVVICVAIKLRSLEFIAALALFVIKEILMLIGGYILIKRKIKIMGSKWYGKVATVVFYVVMAAIAMFESIMPKALSLALIIIAALFMLFAFSQYIPYFVKFIRDDKLEKGEKTAQL